MHALIQTVAFRGIDTIPVNAQVHIANGLPAIAKALAYRAMPLLA
jgi:hypothetical protein